MVDSGVQLYHFQVTAVVGLVACLVVVVSRAADTYMMALDPSTHRTSDAMAYLRGLPLVRRLVSFLLVISGTVAVIALSVLFGRVKSLSGRLLENPKAIGGTTVVVAGVTIRKSGEQKQIEALKRHTL